MRWARQSHNTAVRHCAAQRVLDLLAALLGLIILSPLFAGIAAIIKLTSPGPIIHRGERVGKDGRLFGLYKFRTMCVNASALGPGITVVADPRITPIGRWLRKLKLDELPQLWNVLKGDMSLVGPRPEDQRYVADYTFEQRRVLNVRPGITSRASVRYRYEERLLTGADWEEIYRNIVMPDKLQIELDYLDHRTFLSDLNVLWQTFRALFR